MNINSIKLTSIQLKLMAQIFDNLKTLSKDKDFIDKMELAYNIMDDDDITDENEEDYMQLINFKEDIEVFISSNFPDSGH